jgi:hypothetical protein
VYLVLLLAAGAILSGVVVVAMGHGGEMASFRRDLPLAIRRFRSPAEVASARLPLGPFGYEVQATGDALMAAAILVAERDAEIAALRRELMRLGPDGADADPAANDQNSDGEQAQEYDAPAAERRPAP